MSYSQFNFTKKFFRPPQRTVSCNNGLLDTRTKHTVAQDRWIVAEQRTVDVERQKSVSQLQLITFEKKQIERKLSSLQNLEQSLHKQHRSISEVNLQNLHQSTESLDTAFSKLHARLNYSNQNLLSLPRFDQLQRSFSSTSDYGPTENLLMISDPTSSDEDNSKLIKKKPIILPRVTIIPPEDEHIDNNQSNEL